MGEKVWIMKNWKIDTVEKLKCTWVRVFYNLYHYPFLFCTIKFGEEKKSDQKKNLENF